jgi:hypothetical protein
MMDQSYNLEGMPRVYVIGDIHGRLDLLDQVARKIHLDMKRAPTAQAITVTLKDYEEGYYETRKSEKSERRCTS